MAKSQKNQTFVLKINTGYFGLIVLEEVSNVLLVTEPVVDAEKLITPLPSV